MRTSAIARGLAVCLVAGMSTANADRARPEPTPEPGAPLEYLAPAAAAARGSGVRRPLTRSWFRERPAGTHRYDLVCPHTIEPNPLVVIAPDVEPPTFTRRVELGSLVIKLAEAGLIVVTVAPPSDPSTYAEAIEAVLDAVHAQAPDPREPGCRRTGVIGGFGFRAGGAALLEVARRREAAGERFDAVAAAFVADLVPSLPPLAAPMLIVEGRTLATPVRTVVVRGAGPCDLRWPTHPCVEAPSAGDERALRDQRSTAIRDRVVRFLFAHLGGPEAARTLELAEPAEIVVRPRPVEPEYDPEAGTRVAVSLPILLGATIGDEAGFGFGFGVRPEVVIGRFGRHAYRGDGIGVFGSLARDHGDTVLGGGLTYVAYRGGVGLAPSLGLYHRFVDTAARDRGVTAGVFVGIRGLVGADLPLDLPFGVRVEAQLGLAGAKQRTVIASVQLDLAPLAVLIGGAIVSLAHAR